MTDPARPRPVPGPPRPVPGAGGPRLPQSTGPEPGSVPSSPAAASSRSPAPAEGTVYARLAERPVAEHVAVYEAEHERLQRELSTVDQL